LRSLSKRAAHGPLFRGPPQRAKIEGPGAVGSMLGALEFQIAVAEIGRQILPLVAGPVDEVSRRNLKREILKGGADRQPIGDVVRAGAAVTVNAELELLVFRRPRIDPVAKEKAVVLVAGKRTIGVADQGVRLAERLAPIGQTTNAGM